MSREVVAQMLFAAIQVPCVTYAPALSYNPYTTVLGGEENDSVGYKTFKLVCKTTDNDEWGRPFSEWKLDTNANKDASPQGKTLLTYEYESVAAYTTMADERDIAADIGLSEATDIEAAYIDGVRRKNPGLAASDGEAAIDPIAATSTVGGQGRLTEAYDMGGDGIRLVETALIR